VRFKISYANGRKTNTIDRVLTCEGFLKPGQITLQNVEFVVILPNSTYRSWYNVIILVQPNNKPVVYCVMRNGAFTDEVETYGLLKVLQNL
jgi:hypothetical protein